MRVCYMPSSSTLVLGKLDEEVTITISFHANLLKYSGENVWRKLVSNVAST